MPRKNLIYTKLFPYHVVARVNNKETFPVDLQLCWDIFSDFLYFINHGYSAQVHAFVLMKNHFHLIISTPDSNLGEVMDFMLTQVSRAINDAAERRNHIFGGRYKGSLIQDPYHYAHVYKYVYRNPVKAGICKRVEDYNFSTLPGLLGRHHLTIPIISPQSKVNFLIPESTEDLLNWLNQAHAVEEDTAIGNSLKRTVFKIPSKSTSHRKSSLSFCL